ncbi:MAG: SpoIVB peptidase S55 domain-containing protein [Clostridia bacterium]|nr:SpoIVB peptidase S55 domain-containing protein [Clostridia bacterium]
MKKQQRAAFAAVIILIFILSLSVVSLAAESVKVCPGGMPFGVRFGTGKLIVSGFSDVDTESGGSCPSKLAGLCENDIIIKINGKAPGSADSVTSAVKNSGGTPMVFTVERNGKTKDLTVTPEKSLSTGEFKIGLWLRDGSAGIGTVTYIMPETGAFGGLGHGICDTATGELCDISRGAVSHVTITEISKGLPGAPGELRGIFAPEKSGSVIKNTSFGVFGIIPDISRENTVEVGDGIKEGDATVICTVSDAGECEYSIRLSENPDGNGDTFFVEITDKNLISLTGGIVQGMSGSPIIQDGKLVGAVTHVLINDPTRGYGVTVKKMLESMPDSLK